MAPATANTLGSISASNYAVSVGENSEACSFGGEFFRFGLSYDFLVAYNYLVVFLERSSFWLGEN